MDDVTETLEIVQTNDEDPLIRSNAFAHNTSNEPYAYIGKPIKSDTFDITGDERGALKNVLGDSYEHAFAALKEYSNNLSPATTSATWSGEVNVNYNSNILETSFTLNNQSSTRLNLTFDNGDILVTKG